VGKVFAVTYTRFCAPLGKISEIRQGTFGEVHPPVKQCLVIVQIRDDTYSAKQLKYYWISDRSVVAELICTFT